jgi:Holliday junction resolvase
VTQYAIGKRFEDKVRANLESDGYGVVRAGGSRGAADLVALKSGQTLIIQCKRTNGQLPPAERAKLLDLARICGGLPIVAYQPVPRRPVRYRRLTGVGPSDWVEFTPDEAA